MSTNSEHNKVVVIGGNHHNTLGVVRSLGEKGIRPLVIIYTEDDNPYVAYSKYIDKCEIVRSEESVIELLRGCFKSKETKKVVIACSDNLSSLLDRNYDELYQYYYLPGSKAQGRISELMDKEVMSEFAFKRGLTIPLSQATDTSKGETITIPFPWIIKPLVSKDGSKADIKRVYEATEWSTYKTEHRSRIQIQQLINPRFEYQLIGLSLNDGCEVIIPGVSVVLRPSTTTNTGFLHYVSLDSSYHEVLDKCKKFLKDVGYNGLFSMEFLRGTDGKDYFMEVNFRNDGNAICVTAAGFNLPYIWYLYHTGGDYKEELNNSKFKDVYVMPEFADLALIKHHKLNVFKWVKDIFRTDRFMEYDSHDMKPFWQLIKSILYFYYAYNRKNSRIIKI